MFCCVLCCPADPPPPHYFYLEEPVPGSSMKREIWNHYLIYFPMKSNAQKEGGIYTSKEGGRYCNMESLLVFYKVIRFDIETWRIVSVEIEINQTKTKGIYVTQVFIGFRYRPSLKNTNAEKHASIRQLHKLQPGDRFIHFMQDPKQDPNPKHS